jgi:hypothetical protein
LVDERCDVDLARLVVVRELLERDVDEERELDFAKPGKASKSRVTGRTRPKSGRQPSAAAAFLWRPDFVSGTPIFLDVRPFAAERPRALLQEKLRPGIPPRFLVTDLPP